MSTALFTNFTNEPFTGYWNGKGKTIKAGESLYMAEFLASHFAKHLVNKELLKTNRAGNLVNKNGDKMTSPKFPEQVPMFMDLYNKAFTKDEDEEQEIVEEKENIDDFISAENKNRNNNKQPETKGPSGPPQIISSPDDAGDGEEFEGAPKA